ncbi:MAG TPA: hypothetical protein VKK79_01565 [Candidatus Lokiarchaeia archaeon]|nr:hypothetical protein [Candidatus Lokiarchaeia archaeon]
MVKSKATIIVGTLVYLVCIMLLIALGATIMSTNQGDLMSMLMGVIPIVGAVVLGFLLYRFLRSAVDERRVGKEHKPTFSFKQAIFLIVFLFSFLPFILPLFDHGLNVKAHSIYNQTWSGCSDPNAPLDSQGLPLALKQRLEAEGYHVEGIQSSLSAITRNNQTYKVLVMLGPNRQYNPINDMGFFIDFIKSGGSLLIADDHGSTTNLMFELALYTQFQVPMVEFSTDVVADNYSRGKNPYYPVIQPHLTDFNFSLPGLAIDPNHPTVAGVNKIICDHASAILPLGSLMSLAGSTTQSGSLPSNISAASSSGLTVVGVTTPFLSYLDNTGDFYYNNQSNAWNPSILDSFLLDAAGTVTNESFLNQQVQALIQNTPKIIFAAQDLPAGRLFLSGDASIFSNQEMEDTQYDNARFADNIFSWLSTAGNVTHNPADVTIYFDEAHIGPENGQEFATAYIYGLFIGYVNWLSSSAILAWIYPFIALMTLSGWLPKEPKKKKQKKNVDEEEFKIRFHGETAFVKKIKQLRTAKSYNEPLLMLYRRILRRLHRLLEDKEPTPGRVVSLIKNASKKEITAKDETRIRTFFETMEGLKNKTTSTKIKTEEEFKKIFFEMTWIADFLNLALIS